MQRDYRYTILQDLKRLLIDLLIMIYRANATWSKQPVISTMRESVVEVKVYLRLLCDLKQLSEKQYLLLSESAVNISKQLVAWEKSVSQNRKNE